MYAKGKRQTVKSLTQIRDLLWRKAHNKKTPPGMQKKIQQAIAEISNILNAQPQPNKK